MFSDYSPKPKLIHFEVRGLKKYKTISYECIFCCLSKGYYRYQELLICCIPLSLQWVVCVLQPGGKAFYFWRYLEIKGPKYLQILCYCRTSFSPWRKLQPRWCALRSRRVLALQGWILKCKAVLLWFYVPIFIAYDSYSKSELWQLIWEKGASSLLFSPIFRLFAKLYLCNRPISGKPINFLAPLLPVKTWLLFWL